MKANLRHFIIAVIATLTAFTAATVSAQKVEMIKYGDFENWVTRNIKESSIIGGNTKQVYAIGPEATINGDKPYHNTGGSPWASSNIMAKVMGITKTSNAVFPDTRSAGNRCCRMATIMENCKALGIINIDVLVAGSIFLGEMLEPIKSTSDPYSKMDMGVPFTKRPRQIVFDYRLDIPDNPVRTYSSGFGKKKTMPGSEKAEVMVLLQRRWEDAEGNLYAKRVGTCRERIGVSSGGWKNGHRLNINYGDISKGHGYKDYMGLIPKDRSYYARNSKGKMVPVTEVGWDDANATPTHAIVMFSAASGEPYVGTLGLTFWVDNVGFAY